MSAPVLVHVGGASPYDVTIGRGLLDELVTAAGLVPTAAIVHPESLTATAEAIQQALLEAGTNAHLLQVPDADRA